MIGDGILFHLEQNKLLYVGRAPAANWIQFHAETGGFNVKTSRDDRSPSITGGKAVTRNHYRYQIQGPNAKHVIEKLNGGPIPDIKFFNMDTINIAGRKVRALRHGMAGAPGLEVWGPYAEREEIRAAIVEAGKDFDLRQVGSRAYPSNTLESGWIPSPLPAIYTGDKLKAYREWLPANGYEATGSLGGSFVSNNIEDYYIDAVRARLRAVREVRPRLHRPRGAREDRRPAAAPQGDVRVERRRRAKVFQSLLDSGDAVQVPRHAAHELRLVVVRQGDQGRQEPSASRCSPATATTSARSCRSASSIRTSKTGDEVTLVWGEEGGGTKKATVEHHKQIEIRVVVSSVPYSKVVRETYEAGAAGWRAGQK